MSDIFVSYSRSDWGKARMLKEALYEEGWSVWSDPKNPPGKTFDVVIEQALERAKCVIVLWSKTSVASGWVKAEAVEGKRRGILIPAEIQDDVKIPLEFRDVHALRLTDWEGQSDHTEFGALRGAVSELLDDAVTSKKSRRTPSRRKKPPLVQTEVPQGVYLDPQTRLMWTIEDNGTDITWKKANAYAKRLRLGGYSDWRLPTIEELEKLYDPKCHKPGTDYYARHDYRIRNPLRLTGWWVWSSNTEGSDSARLFLFNCGLRSIDLMHSSDDGRALCVRRSREWWSLGYWVIFVRNFF